MLENNRHHQPFSTYSKMIKAFGQGREELAGGLAFSASLDLDEK